MGNSQWSETQDETQLKRTVINCPALGILQHALFSKHLATGEHGHRIACLCRRLELSLGLSKDQCSELELLSLFHDIGKLFICNSILSKPGPLTAAEWEEIKRHPEIGYRIANSVHEPKPIAGYIHSHHERWDGTGYPRGLKGETIPLLSRLLAVADAYDAMTQSWPYRKAMSHAAAKAEIIRCRGTQFDPRVADAFLQALEGQDGC